MLVDGQSYTNLVLDVLHNLVRGAHKVEKRRIASTLNRFNCHNTRNSDGSDTTRKGEKKAWAKNGQTRRILQPDAINCHPRVVSCMLDVWRSSRLAHALDLEEEKRETRAK